jgi:hypothetical protein
MVEVVIDMVIGFLTFQLQVRSVTDFHHARNSRYR